MVKILLFIALLFLFGCSIKGKKNRVEISEEFLSVFENGVPFVYRNESILWNEVFKKYLRDAL